MQYYKLKFMRDHVNYSQKKKVRNNEWLSSEYLSQRTTENTQKRLADLAVLPSGRCKLLSKQ